MKITHNVRSTAKHVPHVEVNNAKDTVYVRVDVTRIEEIDFSGWNIGTEIEYKFEEYFKELSTTDDTESVALLISMLMGEVDFLKTRVEALEGGVIQ